MSYDYEEPVSSVAERRGEEKSKMAEEVVKDLERWWELNNLLNTGGIWVMERHQEVNRVLRKKLMLV